MVDKGEKEGGGEVGIGVREPGSQGGASRCVEARKDLQAETSRGERAVAVVSDEEVALDDRSADIGADTAGAEKGERGRDD
jgi:hypothetical protein